MNESVTQGFDENDRLIHAFSLPGSHHYLGECYFHKWNGALRSNNIIEVETILTLENLNITFSPRGISYLMPSTISFVHNVAFPVVYRFAFGSEYIKKKKKRFLGPMIKKDVVDFMLGKKTQLSLGPGEYPFTLVLSNSISMAEFTANISLNQPLKDPNITMNHYVGISPTYFTIMIHLAEGAPVSVILKIRKYPGIELESKLAGYCYFECEKFTMKARVERGTHMIDASLYNAQNGITFNWGPFEALPQVYDAFVTSQSSVQVGDIMTVLVFIRADLGNYLLVLLNEGKWYKQSVDYYTTKYHHNLSVSLPFDPTKFVLVKVNLRFSNLGLNHIKISVKNKKQTFNFKSGEVFVRRAPSCLKDVVISGPPMTSIGNNVVQVSQKVFFRAKVILQCVDGNNLIIEWGVVPSKDPEKVPNLHKGYMVKSEKQGYEIDPNLFDPGYYVVIISVSTKKSRAYTPIDRARKFLILHITGGKLNAFIEGGNVKEIGEA